MRTLPEIPTRTVGTVRYDEGTDAGNDVERRVVATYRVGQDTAEGKGEG